ncbi:MAG TPA: polyprenol phosphomannose-dependent alpha 1,6 mannosyltransferase MptB [Rugosimonospora sp.]
MGLIGAGQLTAASYLAAGAHPRGVSAVAMWLSGTLLLGGAWLGLGRRLDRVPPRRLLVIGLSWVVTLLASAPLASRDGYAYACQGALVTHGVDPYANGIAALPCRWLPSVPSLWWHTPTPYGPVWLVLSGGADAGSGGRLVVAIALLRVIALAGVALTAWAGHRLARTLGVDPLPAAWLGVLSPLVLVHAVSGVHNDALLAGFVVAAFAVAARPAGMAWAAPAARAVAAGALLGLAVGVKATALVALPFVVLLVAGDRRWWAIIRSGVATCLGLAAGYAAFAVPSGYGLGWLAALHGTTQLIQWTSVPTGLGMAAGYLARGLGRPGLATPALTAARAAGLLVLAVALVALWLRARRQAARPGPVVVAAGVAMVATVVLAPVAFPWYLLAPLAVLAYSATGDRARYRLALVTAGLALLVLPDGTGLAALTKLPGALLDTALVVTVLVALLRRRHAARATPTATEC